MKTLHVQKYQCPKCKKIDPHEEWSDNDPTKIIPLICKECDSKESSSSVNIRTYENLTPVQAAILRGDKAWRADIKSRKKLPDGSIGRFREDGKRIG